jgi:hypothetical protein
MLEQQYDISGAIVFWSLQPTPYQAVKDIFDRLGLSGCVPNPRTDQSALEHSIKAVCGTKNKAVMSRKRPKRNGVELVAITRNELRNDYITSFGAKVVEGRVKTDYGYADEYRLTEEYLASKALLTTTAVGMALAAAVAKYDGMKGFAKPGVFYIPEHHLQDWQHLCSLIEGAQEGNATTAIRAAMDEGTARAIRDNLSKEVQEQAAKLLDDVSKGTLNDTQLHVRAEQAAALVDRVNLYSSILGEALGGLKNVALVAQSAAGAAAMQDFAQSGVGVCV